MNRYAGNSGLVERIPDNLPMKEISSAVEAREQWRADKKKPSSLADITGGLGGILSKINAAIPETEDLLLIAVLYLLYKESGDIEFLLIAGILLFT